MAFDFEADGTTNVVTIYTAVILSTVISVSGVDYFFSDEDRYVKQFGNKADNTHEWTKMKEWCEEADQLKAKKLCAGAHKKLFSKGRFLIDKIAYKTGVLSFNSSSYQPMRLVYVEYNLDDSKIPEDLRPYSVINGNERWYVTQGFNKDCVFYLTLMRNSTLPEFQLSKPICGLKHKYI